MIQRATWDSGWVRNSSSSSNPYHGAAPPSCRVTALDLHTRNHGARYVEKSLAVAALLADCDVSLGQHCCPSQNCQRHHSCQFCQGAGRGLAVPVRLRYTDEDNRIDTLTDDTIGNATLLLQDGKLHLLHLDFSAGQQQGVLNDALTTLLSSKQRRTFSADGALQIDADASMQLDLVAMLLTIRVSRDAFGQARQSDNRVALTRRWTPDGRTALQPGLLLHQYPQSGHQDSNFLQLESTVGLGAHHVAVDASLYNLGEPEQSGDIYRAMYERDLDDRRIAAGMVSTWDLQTLGVVTGLTTGRLYGASYGNQAQSRKQTTNESTTSGASLHARQRRGQGLSG